MRTLQALALVVAGCAGMSHSGAGPDAGPDLAAPPLTGAQVRAVPWRALPAAPTIAGKQDDLYFVDARQGWSVNGKGRIYHTSDGGESWTLQLEQPGTYFRAVAFLDARHGFASNIGTDYYPGVTDTHPLYETSDGGVSWHPVQFTGTAPPGICNLQVVDARQIVATGRVGGPSFFLRSTDAGASWMVREVTDQVPMLVDVHFTSASEGVITGGSSVEADSRCVILRSGDAGASWQEVFRSAGAGAMCWKLAFPSPRTGYASVLTFGAAPPTFLKTTDGGRSWQQLPMAGDSYAALGIGFISDDIGWIGGEASGKPAYYTEDGGLTWSAAAGLGPYINRFRFIDHTGYAIGQTVFKLELP